MIAAWVLAVYVSGRAIRAYRNHDKGVDSDGFSRDSYRGDGWRGAIAYARDWFGFHRWRRKASYAADALDLNKAVPVLDLERKARFRRHQDPGACVDRHRYSKFGRERILLFVMAISDRPAQFIKSICIFLCLSINRNDARDSFIE